MARRDCSTTRSTSTIVRSGPQFGVCLLGGLQHTYVRTSCDWRWMTHRGGLCVLWVFWNLPTSFTKGGQQIICQCCSQSYEAILLTVASVMDQTLHHERKKTRYHRSKLQDNYTNIRIPAPQGRRPKSRRGLALPTTHQNREAGFNLPHACVLIDSVICFFELFSRIAFVQLNPSTFALLCLLEFFWS